MTSGVWCVPAIHSGGSGGEEFVLIASNVMLSEAITLANMIRETVATQRGDGLPPITVSVGVAMVWPGEKTIAPALARADEALYKAKHGGRNRISASTSSPPLVPYADNPDSFAVM